MSLPSAIGLLWDAGLRNRIRRQKQRLQNPRYLIGTVIGLLYFWQFVFRRMAMVGSVPRRLVEPQHLVFVEATLLVLALLFLASAWLLGADRSELTFSEAEVQFLFTGPVSRVELLGYKLIKSLGRIAFSALMISLFLGRVLAGNPVFFFVGAWLGLTTIAFHSVAASLTRESLAAHGRFGLRHRLVTLVALLLVVGALIGWAVAGPKPLPPSALGLDALAQWVQALLDTPVLHWVLWPLRAPIEVALASRPSELTSALPIALGTVAVHALWVVRSDVAFEQSALEASEARAKRLESRREGNRPIGARRFRLRLSPVGPPFVALAWKNVLASVRTTGVPLLLVSLSFAVLGAMAALEFAQHTLQGALGLLGCGVAMAGLALMILGPSMFRGDLRQDLPNLDILRSLPLSGRQVVWGALAGPATVLGVIQALCWLVGPALTYGIDLPQVPWSDRMGFGLSVAMVGPAIALAGLVVQNLAVLLFPAWVVVDRRAARGIDAMGQRLLTTFGTLVILGVAVLPAAIAGALVAFALWGLFGLWCVPFGAAAAAALIGVEIRLALGWMGGLFERLDVTE